MLSKRDRSDDSFFAELEVIDMESATDLSLLDVKLNVDTSDILPRDIERPGLGKLASPVSAPSIIEQREEKFKNIVANIKKIDEVSMAQTQIDLDCPTETLIDCLYRKHYDSEIKKTIKSFTPEEIDFFLKQKKDTMGYRFYTTVRQYIAAIEKRQKLLDDWKKERTKKLSKEKALRLHKKLQEQAKKHALHKRKSMTSPLGHQDKKTPDSPPPPLEDSTQILAELKYEISIRPRIERVRLVGELALPKYLEADTLYLQLNYQHRCIFVNAAGFKAVSEKFIVTERENSWEWVVLEFDAVGDLLMQAMELGSGDTITIPAIVDQIVNLCGCIQGEKTVGPWNDSPVVYTSATSQGPLPIELANIVHNSSRLLTDKIYDHNNTITCVHESEKAHLHHALRQALNIMAYETVGGFTTNDFVVMYYYLNKYIEKTTEPLALADINLLIAASFLYANKVTEDNFIGSKDLVDLFKIEHKKLLQLEKKFSRIVQGDSYGKWHTIGRDQEAELVTDFTPEQQKAAMAGPVRENIHISKDEFEAIKARLESKPVGSRMLPITPPLPKVKKPSAIVSPSQGGLFKEKRLKPQRGVTKGKSVKGDKNKEKSTHSSTSNKRPRPPTVVLYS